MLRSMVRARRACAGRGCPRIAPAGQTRCAECAAALEARRGTTSARGYGSAHQRERSRWAPRVAAGEVSCARCGRLIAPGEPWHLDHADDRRGYLGPSHKRCNLEAGGRAAHRG